MHVILTDACTGCELCIPPCPVDCIDMLPVIETQDKTAQQAKRNQARANFNRREIRLQKEKAADIKENNLLHEQKKEVLQSYILASLNRVKNK